MNRDFWVNCGRRMLIMLLDYWDRQYQAGTYKPKE